MDENTPIRKQLLSVPNLMGYFRIILIPFIVWRYVTAQTVQDYYVAAVIIGISGITDFLDGFVARKFHQITKVGKALDPIADKLTQGEIVIALASRFKWMIPLIVLFIVKEGFMGIMGVIMLRRGKMLDGAKWYGKVCTAVLYVVMFVLILIPEISMTIANTLIAICFALMVFSLVSYIPVFYKMWKED